MLGGVCVNNEPTIAFMCHPYTISFCSINTWFHASWISLQKRCLPGTQDQGTLVISRVFIPFFFSIKAYIAIAIR